MSNSYECYSNLDCGLFKMKYSYVSSWIEKTSIMLSEWCIYQPRFEWAASRIAIPLYPQTTSVKWHNVCVLYVRIIFAYFEFDNSLLPVNLFGGA